MGKAKSITIVGAGIAGLMSAYALIKKGHKVTIIDRWEPGHARASSSDYNRVIRAIHGRDEFYTAWARESRLQWLALEQELQQKFYYECGVLILATAGHCDWEDATCQTFDKLAVPYQRFQPHEISARFPQFKTDDISYGIYEPEAGMLMAHRTLIAVSNYIKANGGTIIRGTVTTDKNEKLHLDNKPLGGDTIIVATGPWMNEMYPKTVKPITQVIGINVIYTSTPDGSDMFDQHRMPCWIDHGQQSFGLPSSEGSGVKAAVALPDKIDINNDERFIKKNILHRTRQYIATRLPDLVGQRAVDSKFNQIILTPDTHFIADWHPQHENVLLAGGCSGHLFKHAPVFGEFVAGLALRDYGTAPRFLLKGRKKLSPKESPSGR